MKSKLTAALLAFFLGGLGVHKFYLGQGGMGVLYLLTCWTGIPAIVAFIEFIMLLVMDDHTFNLRFNPGYVAMAGARNTQAQNITINMPGGPQQQQQAYQAQQGYQAQQPHQAQMGAAPQPQRVDVVSRLAKLNELRIQGALTDEEFEVQKQKLLAAP